MSQKISRTRRRRQNNNLYYTSRVVVVIEAAELGLPEFFPRPRALRNELQVRNWDTAATSWLTLGELGGLHWDFAGLRIISESPASTSSLTTVDVSEGIRAWLLSGGLCITNVGT